MTFGVPAVFVTVMLIRVSNPSTTVQLSFPVTSTQASGTWEEGPLMKEMPPSIGLAIQDELTFG